MLWCGVSWVKSLPFVLNWKIGGVGEGRLAALKGLIFFPG